MAIDNKNFILINEHVLKNAISFIKDIPLDGKTQIKICGVGRSNNQNAALWGVAYPTIMKETGLHGQADRESLHETFCGEYWGWKKTTVMGITKMIPVRTTTINEEGERDIIEATEMCNFYKFIQIKSSEFGIYVPDPEPQI